MCYVMYGQVRLHSLLQLVLAIGNHMNMGNIRIGQAQGFHIGFLSQLRGLKSTDGGSSLLHFLAGLVERKFPELIEFNEDLTACTLAARGQCYNTSIVSGNGVCVWCSVRSDSGGGGM